VKETRTGGADGAVDTGHKRDLKHGCWIIMREDSKACSSLQNWED